MTATVPEVAGPATDGHRPGSAGYRRVVLALFIAGVATFALLYSVQALLEQLSRRFGVSNETSTWSLSITTLGLGVALLVAGPVSDVIGRTSLIHWSLASSTLIAGGCALAPNWSTFLLLRLLSGLALAGLPAVATAYLCEELHVSAHSRAAGLYIGGTAIGGMTGRLVTGLVADAAGWRCGLAAAAVLGAACAAAVRTLLPPSQRFVPVTLDAHEVLRRARRAVSDPALLALYGTGACSVGVLASIFNTLGFRLADGPFHLGVGAASLVFLVYPVGTLSSALFGRLADRYGRRHVLPLTSLLTAIGLLLSVASFLPMLITAVALVTAGFFATHGIASGWVPARAQAAGVSGGQAASLYLFAYYMGMSAFGTLAGHAWSDLGWPGVVGLGAALVATGAALAERLRRTPVLTAIDAVVARRQPFCSPEA